MLWPGERTAGDVLSSALRKGSTVRNWCRYQGAKPGAGLPLGMVDHCNPALRVAYRRTTLQVVMSFFKPRIEALSDIVASWKPGVVSFFRVRPTVNSV